MKCKASVLLVLCVSVACAAPAQGIVGEVLSGKLIEPEVGVYAVYDLTDSATGKSFLLRQAVVDEERVKRKTAHWVETEIIPELGFPVIYKSLLSGRASDPENIHRVIVKQGSDPPVDVPVSSMVGADDAGESDQVERTVVGMETLDTPVGKLDAEHVVLMGAGDKRTEVWLNEEIRPMGLVRMVTPNGELNLRRYGQGGPDGASAIRRPPVGADSPEARPKIKVDVRVEDAEPEPEAPERTGDEGEGS